MKQLRRLLLLDAIYYKMTFAGIAYAYVYVAAILLVFLAPSATFLNPYTPRQLQLALTVALSIYGLTLLRSIIRNVIAGYLTRKLSSVNSIGDLDTVHANSLDELHNISDHTHFIAAGSNYQAYVSTFDFFWHTKGGDFLARQVFYTVAVVKMQRQLPRLLFDSKTAHRQQFKHLYLKSQRLSVQGPFDRYFDTYAPLSYKIDSLSFITPEVMEVLLEARDYDIEIVDNTLLLYGPLQTLTEVDDMLQKAQAIADQLNDNIDTYRDDNLTGLARQQRVTPFARALLESPFKYQVQAAMSGTLLTGLLAAGFITRTLIVNPEAYLIAIFILGTALYNVRRVKQKNANAKETFYYLYRTSRGKPLDSARQ